MIDAFALPLSAPGTRDVVHGAGPDTLGFLQGQLSQDLERLAPGESAWSFLLQPQGKVDAWVRVLRTGHDEVAIDVDAGHGQAVVDRLSRFKLRTRCDLTLEAGVPVLAVRGGTVPGGLPAPWPGAEGVDLFHPGTEDGPVGAAVDAATLEALRIACGVPAMGAELTGATIPAEVGQWVIDASVSFTKGCYTGQELVARIDSRGGNVPRHLRRLVASDTLRVGRDVVVADAGVGVVTSAAAAPDGSWRALALVQRSVVPPATAVVDGVEVQVLA